MLQIRTNCERCGVDLPNESTAAMICSFECTFCIDCVEHMLMNVCPNCGGGFQRRPSRPNFLLGKYPVVDNKPLPEFAIEQHARFVKLYKDIDPEKR